jgi:hypothetical protein
MKTNSESNLNKQNFLFMNRIRNKFYKPLLEQKRGMSVYNNLYTVSTGSMARRKIGSSLHKVGEVYGVTMSNGKHHY